MNQKTSWDQSLIKKYSSSNHLKMLNQLKSEVIKYPLNKKKNINKNLSNEINNETPSVSENVSPIKNSNINKELNINKSTVSFNNSKDFSIYKNMNIEQKENKLLEHKISSEDLNSSTFKDRLNQIDLN